MQLDHFSRLVAEEIFQHFPDWQAHARVHEDVGARGHLFVELPLPSGADLEPSLYIITKAKQITVGVDHYNGHFSRFSSSEERPDCLTWLRRFLAEEIVIVSWWSGTTLRGATWSEPEILPAAPAACRPYDRVRVRSWQGKHDQDLRA